MRVELRSWALMGLAGIVWVALLITGAVTGNGDASGAISATVPVLLVLGYLFERWGWRIGRIPRLLGVPMVRGTWKGTLRPLGLGASIKVAYLAVEQTLTSASVRLLTDESESEQIAGTIFRRASGASAISYTYLNTPVIDRREASPIHHGAALLSILDRNQLRLEGEYWTERATKGALAFTEHAAKVARSYADAAALFAESARAD
jgi:SMODS-associating 2TM, beta-strand rich effector domain